MCEIVSFEELFDIGSSKRVFQSEWREKGVPFYRAREIAKLASDGYVDNELFIDEDLYEKYINKYGKPESGDIMITGVGTLGICYVVKPEDRFYFKDGNILWFHIKDKTRVLSEYVAKAFESRNFKKEIQKNSSGTTVGTFTIQTAKKMSIRLPNKEKQIEIVNKLNVIQKIIKLKQKQNKQYDALIKSRFVEMFGNPVSNTKGWETEPMGDVAPSVNYFGEFGDKVWLLNLDMVEAQTGRILDYLIVSEAEVGNSTCTFDTSNVLYSKLRPYLNKVVIPDRCGYATSELVPLQPVMSKINREYLAFMLRNNEFVKMINEKVAGAKMPRVSMGDFRKFEVPIPPLEFQEQFAAFVHQVDKLKLEIQKSLDETQTLMDSLMQEYFG